MRSTFTRASRLSADIARGARYFIAGATSAMSANAWMTTADSRGTPPTVIVCADLRGFTERSGRLAETQVIAMLNVLFDAQAKAIAGHGGEILKFIGDGLLAIFPIEHPSVAGVAARNALAAAMQAVEAARGLTSDPSLVGEPPLEIVVALHIGTAIYDNIGAANRLDFTVIGSAVNLVSRIEAVAKTLNLPIVVSADFARAYSQPLNPLGRHKLRGLATSHDLFAPILPSVRM
jgi:adenylate cyclase